MPDLGKYALEVLLSYGITLVLLSGLLALSLRTSARARKRLAEAEKEE